MGCCDFQVADNMAGLFVVVNIGNLQLIVVIIINNVLIININVYHVTVTVLLSLCLAFGYRNEYLVFTTDCGFP